MSHTISILMKLCQIDQELVFVLAKNRSDGWRLVWIRDEDLRGHPVSDEARLDNVQLKIRTLKTWKASN